MKRLIIKFTLLSLIFFTAVAAQSCGGDKKTQENRSESGELLQSGTDEGNTRRMQQITRDYEAKVGGQQYTIHITRMPDDSLPAVMSEMGYNYTDNRILLNIKQGDKVVIEKVFTKADFSSLLDNSFMKKAVLSGMVYNKTENGNILLAASMCYPQTDMCIPVIITVSTTGNISIVKSEQLEDDYERAE